MQALPTDEFQILIVLCTWELETAEHVTVPHMIDNSQTAMTREHLKADGLNQPYFFGARFGGIQFYRFNLKVLPAFPLIDRT